MIEDLLSAGAERMELNIAPDAVAKMASFHRMLMEANQKMNLTRIVDDAEAVDGHYLDSLGLLRFDELLEGATSLCDVGSGAGFPGIPLAIALGDRIRVTLVDSLNKRVEFLNQAIEELELNAVAVHGRAEELARKSEFRDGFDLVTARAVAALPVLIELCMPFANKGGWLICYKGPATDQELGESKGALKAFSGELVAQHSVSIPGRDWDHRLLVFRKNAPTPKAYPRKPGDASRKPLK